MIDARSVVRGLGAFVWQRGTGVLALTFILTLLSGRLRSAVAADDELPEAKPVPDLQVLPLPYDQASFQSRGDELTRYHFGPGLKRPFLYPLMGPAGRSLTRMGHPHDPITHSHHNSVWISHNDVGGVSFWDDRPGPRIVCQRIEQYEDGLTSAWLLGVNAWQDADQKTLMIERRRIEVQRNSAEHWLILIDLQLEAPGPSPLVLGQTPFGLIGAHGQDDRRARRRRPDSQL